MLSESAFERLAERGSDWMGSRAAFCGLGGFTAVCLALVPLVGWSMAQLILTTVLTVITQATAMLIKRTQTREDRARQVKEDELVRGTGADNRAIGLEHADESVIRALEDEHAREQTPE